MLDSNSQPTRMSENPYCERALRCLPQDGSRFHSAASSTSLPAAISGDWSRVAVFSAPSPQLPRTRKLLCWLREPTAARACANSGSRTPFSASRLGLFRFFLRSIQLLFFFLLQRT